MDLYWAEKRHELRTGDAMTLGTFVRINSPVEPVLLLDHLTTLVGGDPATATRHTTELDDDATMRLSNNLGQGFAAIVDVRWHPDGPLPVRGEFHEPGDPDDPPAVVEVWLDTGYSYRSEQGENCVQLHQRLAREALAFARQRDPRASGHCNLDTWGEWWDIDTMEDRT